jgi:hypothetical protein
LKPEEQAKINFARKHDVTIYFTLEPAPVSGDGFIKN